MAQKKDSQLMWVAIAALAIGAVYFFTRKNPFTASVPGTAPGGAALVQSNFNPDYISTSGSIADMISNLSNRGPLQLAPPDRTLLQPLNLDLDIQPNTMAVEYPDEKFTA